MNNPEPIYVQGANALLEFLVATASRPWLAVDEALFDSSNRPVELDPVEDRALIAAYNRGILNGISEPQARQIVELVLSLTEEFRSKPTKLSWLPVGMQRQKRFGILADPPGGKVARIIALDLSSEAKDWLMKTAEEIFPGLAARFTD